MPALGAWIDQLFSYLQDPEFLIVQGVGVLGFGLYIAAFQLLNPRKTILFHAAAAPFFMAHFYGLGHWFLIGLVVTAFCRDLSSALLSDPRVHKVIMTVNLVWLLIYGGLFAGSSGDMAGVVGSFSSSLSQFFRGHFYAYRGLMLAHNVLWLSTYIYAGSLPGAVIMVGITVSNVGGIVRYRWQS